MKKKEAKEYIKETLTLKLSLAGYEEELGGAYTHNDHLIHFPKKLYKYRSFDQFTEDMIENNYLYLCQAEQLDDQFECAANFSYDKIFKNDGVIRKAVVDEIVEMVSDFPSTLNKQEYKYLILKYLDKNNNFDCQ